MGWAIFFKAFVEFITILLLFDVSDFWMQGMWDFVPQPGIEPTYLALEGEILTIGPTTREVPNAPYWNLVLYSLISRIFSCKIKHSHLSWVYATRKLVSWGTNAEFVYQLIIVKYSMSFFESSDSERTETRCTESFTNYDWWAHGFWGENTIAMYNL